MSIIIYNADVITRDLYTYNVIIIILILCMYGVKVSIHCYDIVHTFFFMFAL